MRCPLLKELPEPVGSKKSWPWTEESLRLPSSMPDGRPWPKISIVTPSYNQAEFLEETIRSVLLQGYPNLEYVIMDGGSSDGSVDIIRKYEPWLTYWVSERDGGQTFAIREGMERTSGELVNWLNADDYLLSGALSAISQGYSDYGSKCCVICGNGIFVDHKGVLEAVSKVHRVESNIVPSAPPVSGGIQASWWISRQAWENVKGIDVSLSYIMDIDLYFRCHSAKIPFILLDRELAAYRKHDGTKTQSGWQESILSKRRYYTARLEEVDGINRHFYQRILRRHISSLYYRSLTPNDSIVASVRKMWLASIQHPWFLIYWGRKVLSAWKRVVLG